jgi:hypothetical protein
VRLLAKSSSELVLTTSNDAPKSGSGTAAYGCPFHRRPITVSVHKVRAVLPTDTGAYVAEANLFTTEP